MVTAMNPVEGNPHTLGKIEEGEQPDDDAGALAAFWRALAARELPVPFCPALAEDLYAAYRACCAMLGIVRPWPISRVVPTLMRSFAVHRVTLRIAEPGDGAQPTQLGAPIRKRRILLLGYRFALCPRRDALELARAVREFRRSLRAWELELQRADEGTR